MLRPLLACAVAVPAFAGTAPSYAACAGTQSTGEVCVVLDPPTVNPTGGTITDCVTVNGRCVVPVTVSYPTVDRGDGDHVDVYCRGTGSLRCNLL